MATLAALLEVGVRADTRRATASLTQFDRKLSAIDATTATATTRTTALGKASRTAGSHFGSAAKAAGSAALAYLSISQAKSAVTTTQELAKSTLGLVGNLGFAEKAAGEWSAAARARGVDTKKLGMGFKTLSTQVEAAKAGTETSVKLFKDLGISMKEVREGSTDVPGLMLQIAEGTDKAGSGTERLNTISKLFGRSYQGLAPLIRDGDGALKDALATTEKYGSALHGGALKEQAKLRAETIESTQAWQGLQVTFTQAVTPALIKLHNQFQRISAIMADDKLTDTEKFERVGNIMAKWGDRAFTAFIAVLPKMVERAGRAAPKIVGAVFEGFKEADWNAKLWLFAALGGKVALGGVGRTAGMAMGGPWGAAVAAGIGAALAGAEWEKGVDKGISSLSTSDFSDHIAKEFDITLRHAEKVEEWMSNHPGIGIPEAVAATEKATKRSGRAFDEFRNKAQNTWGAVERDADTHSRGMNKKVSGNVDAMVAATGSGYSRLRDNTNAALKALHAKTLNFKIDLQKHGSSGSGFKHGGMIPGAGNNDTVPAMLTPGEGVITKTAMQNWGGKPFLDFINGYAKGGMVTGDTQGLNPGLMSAMQSMSGASGNSIFVQSGFRSRAEQAALYAAYLNGTGNLAAAPGTSNHETGNAADITPGQGTFGGIASKFGLGFPVPGESWHIELMGAAAKGAFGPKVAALARVILKGPGGPLKSMGQAGLDSVWKSAKAHIAKSMPQASPGGALGPSVATGPIQQMARAMVTKMWGASQWAPFNSLEIGEAGWNPRALNAQSGAAGLAQALPASKYPPGAWPYTGLNSAKLQLQWMMGYIKDRYGSPSGAYSAWLSRSPHWYHEGGEVLPSLDTGGRVTQAGVAQVHPGDVHRGTGAIEVHLHGPGMDELVDEMYAIVDGEKVEIANYTLREGGRNRGRARQLAGQAGRRP